MSLESAQAEQDKISRDKDKQLKTALEQMQAELKRVQDEQAAAEASNTKPPKLVEEEVPEKAPEASKSGSGPMIYLSYTPLLQQNPHPAWVMPLRAAMLAAGYTVYTPWVPVEEQVKDGRTLNSLQKRLLPQLCAAFRLQEELTYDYERVYQTFAQADRGGDFDCSVFRNLWFLSRSSVVIADITAPERLGVTGVTQEMLYARLFDIPVVAVAPESGFNSPWLAHCASVMYTGQFNLAKFLPLIRGFAPLPF